MRTAITSALLCLAAVTASAQQTATSEKNDADKTTPVNIHGTIRSKYEYQTSEGEGRFEVRNARISVDGSLSPIISYKAEIDLYDEGKIKMLDAYTRLKPVRGLQFTIGQMRVPFTIDAHRSPHQQYFANRSFIAKQVGNVRDVGAALGYSLNAGFPIILEAGLFNGSGLTNQKDFWTKSINFSAKAQMLLPGGFNLTLSTQKIKPDHVNVMMYDAGAYWHAKGWHVEAEYLYKHYAHDAFKAVHAFDQRGNLRIELARARRKRGSATGQRAGTGIGSGERGCEGLGAVGDLARTAVGRGNAVREFHELARIHAA